MGGGWGAGKLCDAVLVQYMYCICGRRGGGQWGSVSLVYENRIRVQGYRGLKDKLQTIKTVHTLRYSVLKISEYFRGVVFCGSFGIYRAANLGIWCSVCEFNFN